MIFEEKHSKQHYTTTLHYHNMKTIPHCQSTLELLFVSHGKVEISCQDEHFTAFAGQCLWVLPYEVHSYETLEENDVTVFIFSEDLIIDFIQMMRHRILISPIIPFKSNQLSLLTSDKIDLFARKSILYQLASDVLKGGTQSIESRPEYDVLQKSMLYIQDHYLESISLKTLASYLGYSYNYMSHVFHESFPYNFCEMVNMHRLEESIRLLRNSQLTITQISEQSGFSTIRSFNMVFKNQYGITPGEYRKTHYKLDSIL